MFIKKIKDIFPIVYSKVLSKNIDIHEDLLKDIIKSYFDIITANICSGDFQSIVLPNFVKIKPNFVIINTFLEKLKEIPENEIPENTKSIRDALLKAYPTILKNHNKKRSNAKKIVK